MCVKDLVYNKIEFDILLNTNINLDRVYSNEQVDNYYR